MNLGWNDLPFPFLVVDGEKRILAANARAALELERSEELLSELTLGDILAPDAFDGEAKMCGKTRSVSLRSQQIRIGPRSCRLLTWFQVGQESEHESPAAKVASATILVAEDEDSIRDICRRVLVDAGYQVVLAADGREAIALLSQMGENIDLVLADVVMPVVGGEAIAEYLRQTDLRMPVVFTSGYALRNSPGEFLEAPGVTLLRKPYTLAQLLATVKSALAAVPRQG